MRGRNGSGNTILVTDADRGSAIAIIRSLGRAGFRVIAADTNDASLGFRSRYVAERVVYPPPGAEPSAFVDTLHRAVRRWKVDLVIPVTDEVVHLVARHRDRFEPACRVAVAEARSLRMVMDKSETVRLADRLGVPTPRTEVVASSEHALAAAEAIGWPVVVKTAESPCHEPSTGRLERRPVRYAENAETLARRMQEIGRGTRVLIQEYCTGVGHGVEILAHRGRVITAFQHKRLAEIPLSGGASAWRESVPLDPTLYRHASRLVEALSWSGLVMVEFKIGRSVRLMEINGRVWGSLPLAVFSGVDFPAQLAEMLLGDAATITETKPDYRVGVQAFNLELITLWIIEVLAGRKRYPFLSYPRRREAFGAARGLLLGRRRRFDILSRDDPAPGLAEIPKIARKVAGKIRDTQSDKLLHVLEGADSRRPNLLRVLTYHRVADLSVFERQMEHLATHYAVTSMPALLDAVAGRGSLPARSVMITFDDAYREFAEVAWPILRRLDLPAVLFVPTAFPDGPERTYWWDRLEQALADTPRRGEIDTPAGRLQLASRADRARACSRLKRYLATVHHDAARHHAETIRHALDAPPGAVPEVLGWDDLRRLAGEGLAIGAHSRTHPIMSRLSDDDARREVLGAQDDLRRELGEASPSFCYPNGRYSPAVLDALREAGVAVAFTTRRGTNDLRTADPLRLRRINVSRSARLPVLRARLVHSSVYLNHWRWLFDPQKTLNGNGDAHA